MNNMNLIDYLELKRYLFKLIFPFQIDIYTSTITTHISTIVSTIVKIEISVLERNIYI